MLSHRTHANVDMLRGSLPRNILRFALPIVAASLLQRAFNAFDVIVLGQFAGDDALAAVTSTLSLIDFMLDLGMGVAMGVNVAAATALGRGDEALARRIAHTAMVLGLLVGGVLMAFELAMAPTLLRWMSSPPEILGASALYLRGYMVGLPALMLYNFGSALLRAGGDTRRPTLYLILAGAVKFGLNLLFVALLNMSVAGAALSSVLSNAAAGLLVVRALLRESGPLRIDTRRLRMDAKCVGRIVAIGLPAGVQGVVVALSNMTIQSSINLLGKEVMAGFGASGNLEGFLYAAMGGFAQACLTFTGCNCGAGQLRRVDGVRRWCVLMGAVTGILIGGAFLLFRRPLLGIYVSGEEALAAGLLRMSYMMSGYFVYGMVDALVSAQRGLGRSLPPMIVSLLGMCVFRVVWVFTVFRADPAPRVLLASYPISWVLTLLGQAVCAFFIRRRAFAAARDGAET